MFNTLFENALWRVKNSLRFNVLWNDEGTTTNTVYQYIIQIDNRKSPSSFLPTHDIQQTDHYKRKMACKTHLFPMVCKQFSRCLNRHKPFFLNSNWINFFINNKVKYKRKKKWLLSDACCPLWMIQILQVALFVLTGELFEFTCSLFKIKNLFYFNNISKNQRCREKNQIIVNLTSFVWVLPYTKLISGNTTL